jgi:hypothetical protein
LSDAGYCAGTCPTGFAESAGVCVPDGGSTSWSVNFDAPKSDFSSGPITVVGGYMSGSSFIDDPFPAAGRGAWFDGNIDHYTVSGLTLNHSFTLEFFIRPQEDAWETGTLFASYKAPYDYTPGSVYNFKLSNGALAFSESPSGVNLSGTGETINNKEWQHVGLVVDWDLGTGDSSISFVKNGAIYCTVSDVHLFVQDTASFVHYIGGVRHNWRLYEPFRGFIYQLDASNSPKDDFSDTVKTSECVGDCEVCTSDLVC